ncbi:MAG: M18 family aminopeptidase [Bacillales bacterium]
MENLTNQLINFLDNSHSEFNACKNIKSILDNNHFIELKENEKWNLKAGKGYYVTRDMSSLIAFHVPIRLNNYQFQITATHSDSPCLKIKKGKAVVENGYTKLAIETYGGLIKSSWLDKPLSIAGRVIYNDNEVYKVQTVDIPKDLLIISNLCIHFNREINKGYEYNSETDLKPVIGLGEHENAIEEVLSVYLGVAQEDIIDYDLYLYNREKATVGGLNDEFLFSPKIDNLESTFISLLSFISSNPNKHVNVFSTFNNEEIGSMTNNGADSTFLDDVLKRISYSFNKDEEEHKIAIASSFMLSIDNAHATHPNLPSKSDTFHDVQLNKGVVIKMNANMSYTSNCITSNLVTNLAKLTNTPVQYFYNRSDIRGGSTLGSISQSHVSINSCDIGLAQLAMHSNYEVAGCKDVEHLFNLVKSFYSKDIILEDNLFLIK